MKFVTAILLILLVLFQYRLWWGSGSLPRARQLEQIKLAQLEENERLHKQNQSLAAEVLDLKQGLQAIEERARNEMGMIKADEIFFLIVPQENLPLSGPAGK